jgi:hypothetical protein
MSDQSEQPNPFRSRRFVLSMVVVGFIALLAVIVLISNLAGGKKETAPANTPAASSPATPVDSDPSTCGLKGYETSGTVNSAPKTKWQLVGTVAAPTDRSTVGPGTVEPDGFRSCFAHTPTGALYAAVNMMAITSDKSLTREFATKLVVPGAGQKALLTQAGSSSAVASRYQIAGFKIDSYDNHSATVDLAVNFSTGQMLSFPIQLQWLEGDWKLKTTNDGGFTLSPAQLQSLGGYIPWAGA